MDWHQTENKLKELAKKISFNPDLIIGIARGGFIPARLLSSYLKVKDVYGLTIYKIGNERRIVSKITENLKGKKILLVEDMLETGKSLLTAKKYLQSKGAKVKTACLFIMDISKISPDYYLEKVTQSITFPWE